MGLNPLQTIMCQKVDLLDKQCFKANKTNYNILRFFFFVHLLSTH